MGWVLRITFLTLVVSCWGCGGGEVHESFESLRDALDGASAGQTVEVGPVRIVATSTLTVPAGVTLRGAGDSTVVVAPSDSVAIVLRGAPTGETRVMDLSVETGGRAGFLAVGPGAARIERANVTATRGVAVGAEGVDQLTLLEVATRGPVRPDAIDAIPLMPAPENTATHGIVLVDVVAATLTNVRADAFALFGALFVNSGVAWTGGGADGNLNTGVMASGGSVVVDGIQVCGGLEGFGLIPSYGTVFTDGATVDSSDLTVCDGDGYGMLTAGAPSVHTNLMASGNENAAVWVQDTIGFEMSGASTMLSGNSFAGIVVADSENVSLADGTVEDTRMAVRLSGTVGRINVGDGIQVLRDTRAMTLTGMSLVHNDRTGFLADLNFSGSTDVLSITGVTATAAGPATGAVAQNGTVNPGWDSGITRMGTAETNDAAFTGGYAIVDVVAPTDLPATDSVAAMGLDAVGVVAPTD